MLLTLYCSIDILTLISIRYYQHNWNWESLFDYYVHRMSEAQMFFTRICSRLWFWVFLQILVLERFERICKRFERIQLKYHSYACSPSYNPKQKQEREYTKYPTIATQIKVNQQSEGLFPAMYDSFNEYCHLHLDGYW